MIKMQVRVDDAKARAALAQMQRTAPRQFAAALYLFACRVMTASLRLVPVDTGALRKSHYVSEPSAQVGTNTILSAGYVAPYAGWVHEDLHAEHINGSAKFLEKPYLQLRPRAARMIADDIARMKWGTMPQVPILFPTRGVYADTGALSRHSGAGAAGRDRQARAKVAQRIAQRAAKAATRVPAKVAANVAARAAWGSGRGKGGTKPKGGGGKRK